MTQKFHVTSNTPGLYNEVSVSASDVEFTPYETLESTNTQDVIEEFYDELSPVFTFIASVTAIGANIVSLETPVESSYIQVNSDDTVEMLTGQELSDVMLPLLHPSIMSRICIGV